MHPPIRTAREVFVAALGLSPERWDAYLDETCAGDEDLRRRVRDLLEAHREAGSFMALTPAGEAATVAEGNQEGPRTVIGPYQVIQRIGAGGMGTVFLAEQTEPVKRQVALKVITPGMDTRQWVARFEAERQALALMDHPNIAKVHDGGTTPDGRPYFVMELVQGIPLTRFCDEHRLTPRQRVELFVPVCQAVQHAHHKGIIHRDLKPSNVLVARYDGRPVPKVIDFGIAKAVGQRLTDKTLETRCGALVGTPEYMSPEQAELNNHDIDTRSDIYSLGVLLYELLTGSTPLQRQGASAADPLEALRIIREEEIPRPSARLGQAAELPAIAARRGVEPGKLRGLVKGELDWVVMKALEKDRTRRYETADGLAGDLGRYLADEPVLAGPPGAGYRLRKFVRRNRRVLAMLGLVLLALGAVVASIGRVSHIRTTQQAEKEQGRNTLLNQVTFYRDQKNWPEATAAAERARGLLAQGASDEQRQHLNHLLKDLAMVARLEEIGFQAITEQDLTFRIFPVGQAYAAAFREYGIDLAALDPASAAERVRDSAISEPLLDALDDWDWHTRPTYVKSLARGFSVLRGMSAPNREQDHEKNKPDPVGASRVLRVVRLADGDEWRNRIRALTESLTQRDRDRQALVELGSKPEASALPPAHALLLARAITRIDVAEKKGQEILHAAQRRHPADLRVNCELASCVRGESSIGFVRAALALRPQSHGLHVSLGIRLRNTGQLDQAVAAFQRAIELKSEDHANAYYGLGQTFGKKRAWNEAVTAYTRAIELRPVWPTACHECGRAHAELGQWEKAAAMYQRAAHPGLLLAGEVWREYAPVLLLADRYQDYRAVSGLMLDRIRRRGPNRLSTGMANASTAYLAARICVLGPGATDPAAVVALAEQVVATDPHCPWYLHTLGMAHYRAGKFDRAIERLRESAAAQPAWEANVLNWLVLAMAYHRLGQPGQARQWWDRAVGWIDQAAPKAPGQSRAAIPGLHVHDWLACHVLRREAEVLLNQKAQPAPDQK